MLSLTMESFPESIELTEFKLMRFNHTEEVETRNAVYILYLTSTNIDHSVRRDGPGPVNLTPNAAHMNVYPHLLYQSPQCPLLYMPMLPWLVS
jgi:hypothetical protein